MRILLAIIFCCPSFLCFAQSALISNVNIVDVEKGIILSNKHVIIKDGVIEHIVDGKIMFKIKVDTVINGKGQYLMPGLWDMHTHVWNDATTFPLLIANGVTGFRGMFENMYSIKSWKENAVSKKNITPDFFVAGPIVDGPKPIWPGSVAVKNEEEGTRAVDSLKNKLGVDFIKVYSLLSYNSYMAIAAEAQKQQIVFAGHVPNEVTVVEAALAGQKSQEHLYGMIEIASDSAAYWYNYVKGKIKDSTWKTRSVRKEFLMRTFNWQNLDKALQQIKATNTWICPTLTVNRGIAYVNDTSLLNDARMQYVGNFTRDFWDYRKDFRFKSWTATDFEQAKKEFELKMKIIQLIYKKGIPILAGTDFPNPHCYPGFGIHDELELLVKAGLPAADALKTATINPALYFGISNACGSIAEKKKANMVLLSKNPLQNISHTKTIETVFINGKILGRQILNNMLENVKKLVSANTTNEMHTGMHVDE